jgi:hypothetical protein
MEMANEHKIPPMGENQFSSPYDPLNRQIIAILQEDGRTSFRTIADQLDVSLWAASTGYRRHSIRIEPSFARDG